MLAVYKYPLKAIGVNKVTVPYAINRVLSLQVQRDIPVIYILVNTESYITPPVEYEFLVTMTGDDVLSYILEDKTKYMLGNHLFNDSYLGTAMANNGDSVFHVFCISHVLD